MGKIRSAWIRFTGLFRKQQHEREMAEELESHLQMNINDNLRSGMSLDEARRQAMIKLGGLEQVKEEYRDTWGVRVISELAQDLRYGLRQLRHNPGFTAVAIITLALGIGANTAIFSVVNAVMLRMLPVQKPEQLVQIRFRAPRSSDLRATYTNPLWEQIRDHQEALAEVFAWSPQTFDLADGGEAQDVHGMYTSGSYFSALGVQPATGRLIAPQDDRRGCSGVVVLGYEFWQRRYAGAESAVGSLLRLNGHRFPIIGVAAPGFFGTDVGEKFDVALPICAEAVIRGKDSFLDHRSAWWLLAMGRLAARVNSQQATARLNARAAQIFDAAVPPNWRPEDQQTFRMSTFQTVPAATGLTGFSGLRAQYEKPLEILMVVVGFVLLIVCANIASLMIARASAREREFGIRLSLGASRRRVTRQVLTESLLLSVAGALLGLLFAQWGSALLVRLVSKPTSRIYLDLSLDGHVLGFTAGIVILTALLFGLLPALRATRVSLTSAMKGAETQPGENRSPFRSGRWVVAGQIALSLVLLVGTGLFIRTYRNLMTFSPGFDRSNVLLLSLDVHNAGIPEGARGPFYGRVLDRLKSLPGVVSASQSWSTPISGQEWNQEIRTGGGQPPSGEMPLVWFNWVTPEYFATLRTTLLAGRNFDTRDTATSPRVAIVNETLARRFFAGQNPLGKYFQMLDFDTASTGQIQIVGVVKDSKYLSLREADIPFAYVPPAQAPFIPDYSSFEIRTVVRPTTMIPLVRRAIARENKAASIRFGTLEQQVDNSLIQERLLSTLSGFFGGLALLLTAIGLYGVMAYLVTQRTHEIGIRMALGAEKADVLRMVVGQGFKLTLIGVIIGIAGAFALTQFLSSLLYGVKPTDPLTFITVSLILITVALAACYIPARRAAKVDPTVALRYE
jgi:putative ABC transport system permease protein